MNGSKGESGSLLIAMNSSQRNEFNKNYDIHFSEKVYVAYLDKFLPSDLAVGNHFIKMTLIFFVIIEKHFS